MWQLFASVIRGDMRGRTERELEVPQTNARKIS